MTKKKKIDIGEVLKAPPPFRMEKMVADYLFGSFDEMIKQTSEQKENTLLYLIVSQALAEDKTIREICEQYYVVEHSDGPQINFYEHPIMVKLEYYGQLRLLKRDNPIEIPNEEWQTFVCAIIKRLQKKLEIEI